MKGERCLWAVLLVMVMLAEAAVLSKELDLRPDYVLYALIVLGVSGGMLVLLAALAELVVELLRKLKE
jgi:hypothetical protein